MKIKSFDRRLRIASAVCLSTIPELWEQICDKSLHWVSRAIFFVGILALAGRLSGQTTYTYTGPTTGALDTAANWNPNGVPSSTTTASDTATFDGTTPGALTLTESVANVFGGSGSLGVLVNVASSQTSSLTSGGSSIRLAGVTIASGAGAVTFNNTILIGGVSTATTNTLTNSAASTLIFNSAVQAGGSGARTLTIAGSGTVNFASILGNGGNNINLVKDSASTGLLILGGTNTYTGTTTLNGGITRIANASALGSTTAGTTVSSGATLQLSGGLTFAAEALTLNGSGAAGVGVVNVGAGALENVSGTNNYTGLVTLASSATIAADNGSTLNLTNAGTITGTGFTTTLVGSGTGTLSSIIGTGTGGLNKSGTGTWTLSGANSYAGTTTIAVNGGTLRVDNNGSTTFGKIAGSNAASSITINNGGTLLLSGGGSRDRIGDTTGTMLVAGGTLAIGPAGTGSNAVLEGTGAHNEAGSLSGANTTGLGALTLTGNATLDMGAAGVGTLNFASFSPGSFTLNVINYTSTVTNPTGNISGTDGVDDRLIFATDQSSNLGSFSFGGLSAQEIALGGNYFEIVPVPEPATWLAGFLSFTMLACLRHRRRFHADPEGASG